MTKYETPQVVASYSIDELIEEAAVCTGYDGTPTKPRSVVGTARGQPAAAAPRASAKKGDRMTTYETPQIVASYSIDELIEEAAVCTGYDGTTTGPPV